MNQEIVNAIHRLDEAAEDLNQKLMERLDYQPAGVDAPHMINMAMHAMARLREARALFCMAANIPQDIPDQYGLPELREQLMNVHQTIMHDGVDKMGVGQVLSVREKLQIDADRELCNSTLVHAEIAGLSALTHFTNLAYYIAETKARKEHTDENKTV